MKSLICVAFLCLAAACSRIETASVVRVCPSIVQWSRDQQNRAADNLVGIPEGHAIHQMWREFIHSQQREFLEALARDLLGT